MMMHLDGKGFFPRETEALLYRLGYQEKPAGKVYLAGGFVRDLLLGRENRFLNLLVEGDVADYTRRLQRSLPGKVQTCKVLGTATVYLPQDYIIKIEALKEDFSILMGKEPEPATALRNVLYQRDFTVNTLALELNSENFCRLHDFFGGVKDLDNGKIRILYSLSFVDDPLRLLRLLRMEQKYGFCVDEESGRHMRAAIAGKVLLKISREGIARELRLIFNHATPSRVLQRLHEVGLWQQVFPRLPYNEAMLLRLQGLEELAACNLLAEKSPFRYNTFIIYLSALLYGLSSHDSQYLAHVLRLKRGEREGIMKILRGFASVTEGSMGSGVNDVENVNMRRLLEQWAGRKGAETDNVI